MAQRSTTAKTEPTRRSTDAPVTTGAEAVVAALEANNIEHLFGVQGGGIMPVYDALYSSDLTHVTMAHEQSAAHAADAYSLVAGTPGVCIATSGPGATNLVTGLADADRSSSPLVALTGQVPTNLLGRSAFQEADTVGISAPLTKANYLVSDPDMVEATVHEAFRVASSGRPGPTLVDLPKDVTLADTTPSSSNVFEPPPYDEHGRVGACEREVSKAASVFARAERPVVLAGGGVIRANATGELRRLVTERAVPVVTTVSGVGSFPEDHELSMEVAGTWGTNQANEALQHCDVLVAVGTQFDDRLTGGVETVAPGASVIHVDIDASEWAKNVHVDYPLAGDAATVLGQFNGVLRAGPDTEEWRDRCRQWKRENTRACDLSAEGPLTPRFVVERLNALTSGDTIVTTGVGRHQAWALRYWTYAEPRTWIASDGFGTVGYGLPAAIGARFASDDERSVVCFEEGSSLLRSIKELAVAVRESLDITVVVLNDRRVGSDHQQRTGSPNGERRTPDRSWGPRFDSIAKAFGARGFYADERTPLENTLQAALDYEGPSVVDARVDARRKE